MKKGKAIRLGGFAIALGASALLVSLAVSSTGAYFSSAEAGTISASSGNLNLDIIGGSTTMNFAGLMPGTNVDKTVSYKVDVTSGTVDLWMTFNPNDANYLAFTGAKGSSGAPDGGLGGYGFFQAADSNGGTAFVSGNLAFPSTGNGTSADPYVPLNQTWGSSSCSVDANGRGGSPAIVTSASNNNAIPWCGVPDQILLASNLGNSATGTVTVTFGLNGYKQTQQGQEEPTVPFNLVATQHGQRP